MALLFCLLLGAVEMVAVLPGFAGDNGGISKAAGSGDASSVPEEKYYAYYAAKPIAKDEKITLEMITKKETPLNGMKDDSIEAKFDAINRVSREPIAKGEMLTEKKLREQNYLLPSDVEAQITEDKNNLFSRVLGIQDHLKFAELYERAHQTEKAIGEYNELIKSAPQLPDAYFKRAQLYDRLGQTDLALKDYDQFLESSSVKQKITMCGVCAQKALELGDASASLPLYNRLVSLDPSAKHSYRGRASVYEYLKQYQKAIDDYTMMLKLDPKDDDAYVYRGLAFRKLGDNKRAIADFSNAISMNLNLDSAYPDRAETYLSMKEYEKAIADFDKSIESLSTLPELYENRARAYEGLNMHQKALADLAKVNSLKKSAARILHLPRED